MKLDDDEYCANQLKKLKTNGVSYEELWKDKLCLAVSILNLFLIYIFSFHILYRILTVACCYILYHILTNLFEY